jgi:hypothetical protein
MYFLTDENSKVTFIEFNDTENFIFIGTASGRIYIYELFENLDISANNPNKNKKGFFKSPNFFNNRYLNLVKILKDHKSKINWIYFCHKLNIFATIAEDKSCNLYTFPEIRCFNIIKNLKFSFDYVFISSSPLPCLCLYSKSELSFYTYTINGTLITIEKDGVRNVLSPLITNDNSFNDFLVKNLIIFCFFYTFIIFSFNFTVFLYL